MIEQLKTPFEDLPNPKTLSNWTHDLSYLPVIIFNEIKDYLVYGRCKFYAKEDMKCLQDIKLTCILINETSNYCFVKANILPSMRTLNFMKPGFSSSKRQLKCYLQIVTADNTLAIKCFKPRFLAVSAICMHNVHAYMCMQQREIWREQFSCVR